MNNEELVARLRRFAEHNQLARQAPAKLLREAADALAKFEQGQDPVTESDLGEVIWQTSRGDEGSISVTGANIVARAILSSFNLTRKLDPEPWLDHMRGRWPDKGGRGAGRIFFPREKFSQNISDYKKLPDPHHEVIITLGELEDLISMSESSARTKLVDIIKARQIGNDNG